MSETDELFNFVPSNPNQLSSNRKRIRHENATYSYLKKVVKGGSKVLRIEVYDADKMNEVQQLCPCNAEICIQHVVKSVYADEIYTAIKEVIAKIEGRLETCI